MKTKFGRLLFLTMILILNSNVFAQNLIEVFDGRNPPKNPKATEAETEFIKKEVLANGQTIKNIAKVCEFKCDEDDPRENSANEDVSSDLNVYTVLDGSLTKPKSSQKAYFYHICWSEGGKYATALGGIAVVERQKAVSHFIYSGISGFENIRVLPDINQNGLSEVVLGFASKIDGLLIGRSIGLFEIGANKIIILGETTTSDMTEDGETAYKISAKVGKTPVFYHEAFFDKSESDKSNWQIKKKRKDFRLIKLMLEPILISSN